MPRHGRKNTNHNQQYSYENFNFISNNIEIAQSSTTTSTSSSTTTTATNNFQNLLNIFTNLYKPWNNVLVQTPNYPHGKTFYKTNKPQELPRRLCGDWSSKLKLLRYTTSGSYLGLHFVSDYSHHYGGYKAKVYMENGK